MAAGHEEPTAGAATEPQKKESALSKVRRSLSFERRRGKAEQPIKRSNSFGRRERDPVASLQRRFPDFDEAEVRKAIVAYGGSLHGAAKLLQQQSKRRMATSSQPSAAGTVVPNMETETRQAADNAEPRDAPLCGQPQAHESAPSKELPDRPGIDAELEEEIADESPEERERRLEWISYFVREGDVGQAIGLGWDGKPFRQAPSGDALAKTSPSSKQSSDEAPAPSAAQTQSDHAMHRI